MTAVVGVVLGVLLTVPVVLLTAPLAFRVSGHLATVESWLLAEFVWAGGLVKAQVQVAGKRPSLSIQFVGIRLRERRLKPRESLKSFRSEAGKKEYQRTRFPLATFRSLLNRELFASLLAYLGRVLSALRLHLNLSGYYGTGDPALTGILAGILGALAGEPFKLNLNPDFDGPRLDLKGTVRGRLIPIVILCLTVRLLLAVPVRRLWWAKVFKKRREIKEATQNV